MSLEGFNTYTRVNWQQSPSKSTSFSAANLNIMDAGIKSNNDMISNLIDEFTQLNSNLSNNNIESVFNYLAIEFTIFRKSGIYYLHCSGRLTEDFPTDWTTIAQVPNLQYKGIGHIVTNSTGTPIKIAYNNGELRAFAIKSGTKNEYVQDSCIII